MVHEERARAWTEAPSSVTDLWRQRWRWGYRTLQCSWKHRTAVWEGGASRRLGLLGLPYVLVAQVILPVLAPVIDVFALHGLLTGSSVRVVGIWGATWPCNWPRRGARGAHLPWHKLQRTGEITQTT